MTFWYSLASLIVTTPILLFTGFVIFDSSKEIIRAFREGDGWSSYGIESRLKDLYLGIPLFLLSLFVVGVDVTLLLFLIL